MTVATITLSQTFSSLRRPLGAQIRLDDQIVDGGDAGATTNGAAVISFSDVMAMATRPLAFTMARLSSASSASKAATPSSGSSAHAPRKHRSALICWICSSAVAPIAPADVFTDPPADENDVEPRPVQQTQASLGRVRDDRETRVVRKRLRDRDVGRTRVQQDDLLRPDDRRRGDGEPLLAVHRFVACAWMRFGQPARRAARRRRRACNGRHRRDRADGGAPCARTC